jgi:hypothetical protein
MCGGRYRVIGGPLNWLSNLNFKMLYKPSFFDPKIYFLFSMFVINEKG